MGFKDLLFEFLSRKTLRKGWISKFEWHITTPKPHMTARPWKTSCLEDEISFWNGHFFDDTVDGSEIPRDPNHRLDGFSTLCIYGICSSSLVMCGTQRRFCLQPRWKCQVIPWSLRPMEAFKRRIFFDAGYSSINLWQTTSETQGTSSFCFDRHLIETGEFYSSGSSGPKMCPKKPWVSHTDCWWFRNPARKPPFGWC